MKTILASVCLALSLLLPAQATGYDILLPWLAPQGLGFTLGKAILDFAEDKKRSELDTLVLDKTRSLPADIPDAFNKITTPVAASFLAYSRLHNKTVDENNFFSRGIAWSYLVIRLHQADKDNNQTGYVTGWYAGANGSDYQTYGAFESVSRAFIGRWNRSGKDGPMELQWRRVDRKGEGKIHDSEGYEHFIHGKADPDNATICGDWEAYSERLKIQGMEHQKGTMRIILERHGHGDYSFNMNKVKRSRAWNDEKVRKAVNDFNAMAFVFGTKYFSCFFTHEEQEQLVAYYVDKAWDFYSENLPPNIKSKKGDILKFKVNLKHQFYSDNSSSLVPMQFSRSTPWILNISTGTFLTNMVEDKKRFKSRLSLIAHEVLGHGIFFRYSRRFINNIANELLKENFKTDIEIGGNKQTINISSYPDKDGRATKAIEEGLAVAAEYAVYQKEKKICISLSDFMQIRYIDSNGMKAALYKLGVDFLMKKGIINNKGELNFKEIYFDREYSTK